MACHSVQVVGDVVAWRMRGMIQVLMVTAGKGKEVIVILVLSGKADQIHCTELGGGEVDPWRTRRLDDDAHRLCDNCHHETRYARQC